MAADLDALLRKIRDRLAAEADPKRAAFGEGYHATAMRIRGVRTPILRSIAGDLARRLREEPQTAAELASRLIGGGGYEERTLAYTLLSRHGAALASLHADRIEALGAGMDNRASMDAYCTLVAGPAWLAGQLGDEVIDRWSRSPDRWWRRAALVATTALNKKRAGNAGDAPRTLALCERLAADREDMVVKAVSWALRALSVRDPDAVRAFLDAHEGVLATRVRREVRHKLETGLKNPRRRSQGLAARGKTGALPFSVITDTLPRRTQFDGKRAMTGIIYCLENTEMPNVVKIGQTTDIEQRLHQLDNTSVPVPFVCVLALAGC